MDTATRTDIGELSDLMVSFMRNSTEIAQYNSQYNSHPQPQSSTTPNISENNKTVVVKQEPIAPPPVESMHCLVDHIAPEPYYAKRNRHQNNQHHTNQRPNPAKIAKKEPQPITTNFPLSHPTPSVQIQEGWPSPVLLTTRGILRALRLAIPKTPQMLSTLPASPTLEVATDPIQVLDVHIWEGPVSGFDGKRFKVHGLTSQVSDWSLISIPVALDFGFATPIEDFKQLCISALKVATMELIPTSSTAKIECETLSDKLQTSGTVGVVPISREYQIFIIGTNTALNACLIQKKVCQ